MGSSFGSLMRAREVHLLQRPREIGTLNAHDYEAFAELRKEVQNPRVRAAMRAKRLEVKQRKMFLFNLADTAWKRRYGTTLPKIAPSAFSYENECLLLTFKTCDLSVLIRKDCFVEVETSDGIYFVGIEIKMNSCEASIIVPYDGFKGDALTQYRVILSNLGYGDEIQGEPNADEEKRCA